ncbi:hypothetical protein DPX16_23456 [Anabarilius grahami]|uniref:Uncharacterized protein n=1 Tax=Anabarilius grahami TaxID=495550 RepID=A0A3N0XWI4_ANAGA|nr:hypothetical protein DPX16_23456 [Anabarilius grahami]
MDTFPCFIRKDPLDCFEPLLNSRPLKIWAQLCELLPFQSPRPPEPDSEVTEVAGNLTAGRGNPVSEHSSSSLPGALQLTIDCNSLCSKVNTDSQLNDVATTDIIRTLWADNSAFSHTLLSALIEGTPDLPCDNKQTHFPLDFRLPTMTTVKDTCVLNLKGNDLSLTHHFLDFPDFLTHSKAHMDSANKLLWAPRTVQPPGVPVNTTNFLSGQTIQQAYILINIQEPVVPPYTRGGAVWLHTQETVVPPYTKGGDVWLNRQCSQTLSHMLGSLTLSPKGVENELSPKATPLTEVSSCVAHSWLNNCMATDTSSPIAYQLGWILNHNLHDFELRLTVISSIPDAMVPEGSLHNTSFTASFKSISITSIKLVPTEQVRRTELMEDQHLAVPTVANQPACETQESAARLIANLTADTTTEEPLPRFESEGQQSQKDANALKNDADCQKLRQVLNKFKVTFAKDLLDCGRTKLHQEPTRVSPTELVTAWQVTLPLHLYQPGDSSLITAYSTHQHLNKLRLQLREQLATQSQTLQTICKYWKGIAVVPCTHSFLLIQTVNSMKQLFTVFQNDFAQNQLVMALMTDLLREVSFSMDRVAMNRILQYPMQTVLDFATDRPTRTVPAHLANFLGAAILLQVDPKQNEVAVLLNLPSGEPDNISRPKDKVNVRWWQCNTHAKKHTSDVIAYHNSNPRLCLAPHFCRCSVTKDFQYFCPNQLFLRNHTEGMGRLLLMISDTRCPAEAKPRTPVIGTQAEIVGDRLLVHTPTHAATLTYNQHNTATHTSLPNHIMWIQMTLGSILHRSNLAAYCLSSKEYQSKLEIPSSSRDHHHTLDPGLELRIEKGGSQLIDITPADTAPQALSRLPVLTSSPRTPAWTAANTALCLSMTITYALALGLAFILSKGIKGMEETTDKCLAALPRGPVGTTCCPPIPIHVPSYLLLSNEVHTGTSVAKGGSL